MHNFKKGYYIKYIILTRLGFEPMTPNVLTTTLNTNLIFSFWENIRELYISL